MILMIYYSSLLALRVSPDTSYPSSHGYRRMHTLRYCRAREQAPARHIDRMRMAQCLRVYLGASFSVSKHVSMAAPGATMGHTLSSMPIWQSMTCGPLPFNAAASALSNSSTVFTV